MPQWQSVTLVTPLCTAQCLALSGSSNLRPRMPAIQAIQLLHLVEATTDRALNRGRILQNCMPAHNRRATAILVLNRAQEINTAFSARPGQHSSLPTNPPVRRSSSTLDSISAHTGWTTHREGSDPSLTENGHCQFDVQRFSRIRVHFLPATCRIAAEKKLRHARSSTKCKHTAIAVYRD